MPISRMDLADTGSPEGLAKIILREEPNLPIPVPIDDLCSSLDITELTPIETNEFEGGLITDTDRSIGIILYNRNVSEQRRRFTIAHELGHFLMPTHVPGHKDRFLCSRADMETMTSREADRRARMEVEANRFASLVLIPPPVLRQRLTGSGEPDLQDIPKLARFFNVSKEAIARSYVNNHDANIAILVTKNGQILRTYKNQYRFPFITAGKGSPVPAGSLFYKYSDPNVASNLTECLPDIWIDVQRGHRAPEMQEQIYPQQNGFAMIMLYIREQDEDDLQEEQEIARGWNVSFPGRTRRR